MSDKPSCRTPEPIASSGLLLVEGQDEALLFRELMKHIQVKGIEVRDLQGKYSLVDKIRAVTLTSGFDKVTSLGVVRDADKDAQGAFNSVQGALRENGLAVPSAPMSAANGKPTLIVLIVPYGAQDGMLEDVCLQSVQSDPAMECLGSYFDCLQRKLEKMPSNRAKAKAHAFLASRPRAGLRVGEAAQEGYWNFDSSQFDPLKRLLQLL